MLKQKIAITLAAGALLAGLGVASALADNSPAGTTPTATTTTTSADDQQGQEGVDEQGAANDIAQAANDVQNEADNQSADDQSGDQQGPNDNSEEQGDNNQSDNGQQGD